MLAPDFLLYVGLFPVFRISSCNTQDTFLRSGNRPATPETLSCIQENILQRSRHFPAFRKPSCNARGTFLRSGNHFTTVGR
jgi:hypothetical protein